MNLVNVGYSSTNYYVLEANPDQKHEKNKVRLLIDVGLPGSYGHLLANLKRADIPLASISYLLVTHYHPDHAGVVEEVKAAGVRLIVMEPQVAGVELMKSYIKADSPYKPIRLEDAVILPIAESRAFLQKLGFAGEIITTPGHSDDSVSLILDDGNAFVGDLTFPGFATDEDRGLVMSSWQKLADHHARHIYSGHSPTPPVALPVPPPTGT